MTSKDKQKMLEKDVKIAALGGAGLPLSTIAREVGLPKTHVQYVLEKKVESNKNGLGDVYEHFREEVRPDIQNIIRVVLTQLAMKITGKHVEIRDLVSVYNVLSGHAGLGEISETTTQTRTATVDVKNPAVVKALREALVTERVEQTKALAAGVTG